MLLLFDTAPLTQFRYILLDSFLMFFQLATLYAYVRFHALKFDINQISKHARHVISCLVSRV